MATVSLMTNTCLRVLVTGGAGFIGSHTCKALAKQGILPVTYDNLSRGNAEAVKWGPLEIGDIMDERRLKAVFELHRPMAVMHFAAYAYVGESAENPALYYVNNCAGAAILLRALLDFKPVPFVFSSSCATYGLPNSLPISEDQEQRPINPYGRSKLFVEQMLADVGNANALPWVALRYFNAAGSDPEGEIGESHDPETHLIPLVLRAAQSGMPVQIYGTDFDTADGTCIRDYVHVSDLADAHVSALDYLLAGGESAAFNLANARGYSVREVITIAERVSARAIPTEISPRRAGDPPELIGNAERARKLLNWIPVRSALDVQISDAWHWLRSRSA